MRISWKRIVVALLLAVAIHILVWLLAPRTLVFFKRISPDPAKLEVAEREDVVVPEELLPEEFRKKPKFVPVNPNAPEKMPPLNTENESAANQRAAQEDPDPTTRSRTPTVDGESLDSRGFDQEVLPRELLPPDMRELRLAKEESESDSETPSENTDDRREGLDDKEEELGIEVPTFDDGTVALGDTEVPANSTEDAVPDPQPRETIAPPPGLKTLTMKSNTATNEIGTVALDAQFSEFGDYTQRMLEAIEAAWYVTCRRSDVHVRGAVCVRFCLNSDGTIKSAEILRADAPEAAVYACQDAIESRAPYEEWSEDMTKRLGDEQTTTIWFYYR